MDHTAETDARLAALAAHLAARRPEILRAWSQAVGGDAELTTAATLTRTQFHDHIPDILDDLEARLLARTGSGRAAAEAEAEAKEDAATHGLLRWQQGYHLCEVTREWGHLHLCLLEELEGFAKDDPEPAGDAMPAARRILAELCHAGLAESTSQYFQLKEAEAAGHVRDLERALDLWKAQERERAEAWRQAAHDLRGSLGVVTNVSSVLGREGVPGPMRAEVLRILQNGVGSLHALLEDVLSLARLQAGHERRRVGPFDAAELLRALCDGARAQAVERGLTLEAEGPASFPVEGDPVKVRRIVQNLLLNALKFTERGGVTVTWGTSRADDDHRWMLGVSDTGPGYNGGPGGPLAGTLEEATEKAKEIEAPVESSEASGPDPAAATAPQPQGQGEGIGLSIVKHLCELLDATLELESRAGAGSTFRVILPRRYDREREALIIVSGETTPMDPFVVRILGPDEVAVLSSIVEDVFDGPIDLVRSAEFLADPRHHLAVAMDGGLVVGMASGFHYIHPDKPPELWINEVGVATPYRNRGLGKRLLAALLAHGRSLGCVKAWLLTERDNEAARRLYAAAGGRESPEPPVLFEFPLGPDA